MSSQSKSKARIELGPAEAGALDALIDAMAEGKGGLRATAAHVPPQDAAAAERVAAWMALVGQCPAEDAPADLTAKAVQRIADFDRRRRMMVQQPAAPKAGFGMRWAEVGTVAALLLIGASLMWPALDRVREDSMRTACQNNLALAGRGFERYAADYDSRLPNRGSKQGTVWWNVGKATPLGEPVESNSAHLYNLVRTGYVTPETLNCPENPDAPRPGVMTRAMTDWEHCQAVSYSYQNQYTPTPIRIDRAPQMAILADKNPLFVPHPGHPGLTYNGSLPPTTPSPLHRRQGQNVLRADGHAGWMAQPVLENDDNIWLANGVRVYDGTQSPAGPDDSFLVP